MEEGWYRDPYGEGDIRWWDGQQWTEHVESMPAETPPSTSGWGGTQPQQQSGWGTSPQSGYDQGPQGYDPSPRPGFGASPQSAWDQAPQQGFGQSPQGGFGQSPQGGFGPSSQQGGFGPSAGAGRSAGPGGFGPGTGPGAGPGGFGPGGFGPGGFDNGYGQQPYLQHSPVITQAPRSRRKMIVIGVAAVLVVATVFSALTKKPAEGPGASGPGESSVPVSPAPASMPAVPLGVPAACTNWVSTAGTAAAEIDRIVSATFEGGPASFPAETFTTDKAAMLELLDVLQRQSLVPNMTVLQAVAADPNATDAVRAEIQGLLDRATNATGLLGMTLTSTQGAQSAEQLSTALNPGLQSLLDLLKQPPGQPSTVAFLQQFPECGPFVASIPAA